MLPLDDATAELLLRFPRYFDAVHYATDRDSGHWEEGRKLNASSIGTVLAGLVALRGLLRARPVLAAREGAALVDPLLEQGRAALGALLPDESRGNADPRLDRGADAALLFLLHPLRIVTGEMADVIVERIGRELLGPHGIRRYRGDSYWCADYKRNFDASVRTAGFGADLADRDATLLPGTEAQWCLFDPVLSCWHGWPLPRHARAAPPRAPGLALEPRARADHRRGRRARRGSVPRGLVDAGLARAAAPGGQRQHAAALDAGLPGLRIGRPAPDRGLREGAVKSVRRLANEA